MTIFNFDLIFNDRREYKNGNTPVVQFSIFKKHEIAKRFRVVALPQGASHLRSTLYVLRSNHGYSLVEVLVAISVLMIALIGPLTIASSGLQRAFNSREQTTAIFLAQEALEGVIELRETSELQNPSGAGLGSFSCTSSSPCGVRILDDGADIFLCTSRTCDLYLVQEGGQPKFQHDNTGEATGFRREVVIEYASDNSYSRVISTVSWGTDAYQEVSMDTYIYDIYEG